MRVQQIKMILQGMNLMNLILCLQGAKKLRRYVLIILLLINSHNEVVRVL